MSSLLSANGPSTMATRLPFEYFMRAPLELACRPLRSSSTPAFISSSLYLPMALSSASLGMTPASDSLLALTIIMNFMIHLSFGFVTELLILAATDTPNEPVEIDNREKRSGRPRRQLRRLGYGLQQRPG